MGSFSIIAVLGAGLVVVIVGSFVGTRLGKMPGYGWRLAITLAVIWTGLIALFTNGPPRLSLDLVGGIDLVYELAPEAENNLPRTVNSAQVVQILRKRLKGMDVEIRPLGDRNINVLVPGDLATENDDEQKLVGRIKEIVEHAGSLEFRILANEYDHSRLIERSQQELDNELTNSAGQRLAWWLPMNSKETLENANESELVRRISTRGEEQILVVADEFNVTGELLQAANPGLDDALKPCIDFSLTSEGAKRFGSLTGHNLPTAGITRRLGVILNGKIYSAPLLQSAISDRGRITGQFTQQEVSKLANVLNAGSIPGRLELRQETLSYPLNSSHTIRAGAVMAVVIAGVLLLLQLFVVLYYRLVGLGAVAVWYASLMLIEATLLFLHVRQISSQGILTLGLCQFSVAMAILLICTLIRGERMRDATVLTAIRGGVVAATLPLGLIHGALVATGMTVYVLLGDDFRLVGLVMILAGVYGFFTCIFCFHSLMGIVERLLCNAGPTTTRLLFPGGIPSQEMLAAPSASGMREEEPVK
ncbi:MAG: SecDF P1 head subdomain-containing protein [Pirellulaceae bacterium]